MAGKFGCDAPKATVWEKQLGELGLTEDQARLLLANGDRRAGDAAPKLRAFVRRVFQRRYVPEDVLFAMGLHHQVESSRVLSMRDMHSQKLATDGD